MSQPHPPIPEPQPHTDDGTGSTAASAADLPTSPPPAPGPRTNSILVPPTQRHAEPEPAPEPFRTAQFPAVRDEPAPPPSTDPQLAHAGAPVVPPAAPTSVPGPVAGSEPHPFTTPVSASGQPDAVPPAGGATSGAAQPGAAHRAAAQLAGVRRAAGGRTALAGLGLGALALVLLQVGLVLDDDRVSLWEAVPTWSTFATLAVLVALVPVVAPLLGRRVPARTAWRVGAGAVAALAVFWVLIGLPLVVSDRGFWLTAALGAAGAALWLAPGRTE
ncbi:hypothetical protein KUM42_10730 [Modestobacter sp. L9-4]|uniref:hypothetical protein n=1 Tax=Modestobacter sp. L9-4 TaxID=2851567 RepID=UPI001C76411A|nr:hypothetical protein [Modestobacter sp. L9-4]QXG74385.1 hypothetical protein KUM42_10730 [Modestobacter sp. L9-4]